jgi:hypothetical protein
MEDHPHTRLIVRTPSSRRVSLYFGWTDKYVYVNMRVDDQSRDQGRSGPEARSALYELCAVRDAAGEDVWWKCGATAED